MKRSPSLFLRLLALTLPVELVILSLFGAWLIRGVDRRELDALDAGLRAQRSEILGEALFDPAGRLQSEINPRSLANGTSAAILDDAGKTLWEFPPGWFTASGLRPTSREALQYAQSLRVGGAPFRVIDETHRLKRAEDTDPNLPTGPLIEVVLASPLAGLQRSSLELREKAFGAGLVLLALTLFLLWAAIATGLSPVRALMERLHAIPGPSGLARLDEQALPQELRPLGREINGLLDRLWGLIELEKRFTAEAAHELRTPLALVKSTLQTSLLTGGSREDLEGALREALDDLERLEKSAESLLALAQADALSSADAPAYVDLDLAALIGNVAQIFATAAKDRSLTLTVALEPCQARGDAGALGRLFSNLLDNAIKYTAPGGRIAVTCRSEGGSALATVEDTGPRIPGDERARLFRHFFRGSSGREAGVPGAGLGLSIASAIARQHGTSLEYEPSGTHGNRFVVRFLAAESRTSGDQAGG